jgi:hypothetical protein
MVRLRRYRRFASLLCALQAAGSFLLGAPVAHAGLTEALPGTTAELTGAVEEVAKGVVPPVQETVETVAPPAAQVTETVAPPATEATGTATQAVEEVTHAAGEAADEATHSVPTPPPVSTPKVPAAPTVHLPAAGSGSGSGGGAAAAEPVRSAPRAASPETAAAPDYSEAAPEPQPEDGGVRSESEGAKSPGGDRFKAPSTDGSVRAPLPKWVAYVWPAVALTRPDLVNLWRRWEREAPGFLLSLVGGGGEIGHQGIAGVHAAHDGRAAGHSSDGSTSPLAKIPAAVGGFTSGLPEEALAYLVLVAILVAAVFAGVKYEMARHNRRAP